MEGDQEAFGKESGKSETRKRETSGRYIIRYLTAITSSLLRESLSNNRKDIPQNLSIGGQEAGTFVHQLPFPTE